MIGRLWIDDEFARSMSNASAHGEFTANGVPVA